MRLLVTGGAGFIGSHYVRQAISGGYPGLAAAEIVVLDKLTYAGNLANLRPVAGSARLTFVRGDVLDEALVDELVGSCDQIVHFAAESHVDRSIQAATDFVRTNVVGTQVVLDAARRHAIERFVHVSTDEVYGSIPSGSWTEGHVLAPTSPYSASKAGSDLIALAYHRTHGVPVSVTRCSNNYGPYQYPEKVIPLFVTNLLDGLRVPLYGDGNNVRDWLHVDDHCAAIELVRSAGQAGRIYNVGGGRELTNRALTEYLLEACGAGWDQVDYVEDRLGHDLRYAIDDTTIRTELGYRPRRTFEEGLASTVRWYRENRSWWEPLKYRGSRRERTLDTPPVTRDRATVTQAVPH